MYYISIYYFSLIPSGGSHFLHFNCGPYTVQLLGMHMQLDLAIKAKENEFSVWYKTVIMNLNIVKAG